MAEKILMIALSPTMQEGIIARWKKREGDEIKSGESICEVETDKATMEYESTTQGTLLKILVSQGQSAAIGDVIGVVGKKGENIDDLLAKIPGKREKPKAAIPQDVAKPGQAHLETPGSQEAGVVMHSQKSEIDADARIKISPLARNIAKDAGIDTASLTGSGPQGRIVKRDIERAIEEQKQAPTVMPSITGEVIPISQKRRIVAQRLTASKFSAPHYYLKLSVNMEPVLAARDQLNASMQDKVSLNAFFVKFCAECLKRHQMVNATWRGEYIEKHSNIDIAFAVAQPEGLVAPVLRNCQNQGILAIDRDIKTLIAKAMANRLMPEELENATFTISNLGSFGIEEFTAIINPPGSAILALGEVRKQPVVENDMRSASTRGQDQIIVQSRMKMTLSCDHRIIDGAVGAAFLKELKDMLENPIRALY